MRTIQLFMWGYQPHFCFEVKHRATTVLQLIAPGIEPDALLIGIRAPDVAEGHAVCVEPEAGKWDPSLFFGCATRADAIFEAHPDQKFFYGDEPSMRDKPENIRKASVREAVEEVLASYDAAHGTVSTCGTPARVGNYHVVPVLQFVAAVLDRYPRLDARIELDRFSAPIGFLESVVEGVLRDATAGLQAAEPGRFLGSTRRDPYALLREAGDRFCGNVTLATGDLMLQEIFEAMNVISSLLYEGSEAGGAIEFAPRSGEGADLNVRLKQKVRLTEHKLVRKVVEMSGPGLACICCDSGGIAGLGRVGLSRELPGFRVSFAGHYHWELYNHDRLLMQSRFGVPGLPTLKLSPEKFISNARRVFVGLQDDQLQRLWSIASVAMEQKHGTMIVFSAAAQAEATRLAGEAILIEPMPLTSELVRQLTGIDGALLVDTEGVCRAIGVILDGFASPLGDPSRGARYNSALRYLYSAQAPTMCLVVSEDGYVNAFPDLRPQIKRSEVEAHVQKLRTQSIETYSTTRNWLNEHRFYLTESQCRVVNDELERIHAVPQEVGEIRWAVKPFEVDPRMNEDYYLPEESS